MSLNYFLVKLLRALFTVWIVVTFTFVVLMISGDPIESLVGDDAPPEVVDYDIAKYGLDRPLHEQYFRYIGAILNGDFGISFSDETPAINLVLEAIPKTITLVSITALRMGIAFASYRFHCLVNNAVNLILRIILGPLSQFGGNLSEPLGPSLVQQCHWRSRTENCASQLDRYLFNNFVAYTCFA